MIAAAALTVIVSINVFVFGASVQDLKKQEVRQQQMTWTTTITREPQYIND